MPNNVGNSASPVTGSAAQQWQAALRNRRSGVPQLVRVDMAMVAGTRFLENELRGALDSAGQGPTTDFALQLDRVTQQFQVQGDPLVKKALEGALNDPRSTTQTAALREGVGLLDDMGAGFAAVREQYRADAAGGGGYRFRFGLVMRDGVLSTHLVRD